MPAREPFSARLEAGQVAFAGAIDETAQLGSVLQLARGGRLVLDLAHVTFINSIGVREWIRMQTAAAAAGVRIELRRVAEPIVHQLNIVPATRGVSIVSSFYAPYECTQCEHAEDCLIDVATNGAKLARMQAPQRTCPRCRGEMALADPPELYLAFLAG